MPRNRAISLAVLAVLPLLFVARAQNIFSQSGSSSALLSGSVKSADGKPLAGIGVSARGSGDTFTMTVYSDDAGRYSFPPMKSGKYKIRAQAVGFETSLAEAELADGAKKQVDLSLASLTDFHKQLSGTEWAASLPEDTPEDRRMKTVFINNCSGCHQVSFLLQNRFDAAGWAAVMTLMEKMLSIGYAPEDATPNAVIHSYKPELSEYLGRVRGPANVPLQLKLLPRPTGEAARVVVTEYDLSRPDMPGWIMEHNGTDWMEGTPSRWNGRAAHDVAIDKAGFIWFADDATPDRTLGRLDPRTGSVANYKMADDSNSGCDFACARLRQRRKHLVRQRNGRKPHKIRSRIRKVFEVSASAGSSVLGRFHHDGSQGKYLVAASRGRLHARSGDGKIYELFSKAGKSELRYCGGQR